MKKGIYLIVCVLLLSVLLVSGCAGTTNTSELSETQTVSFAAEKGTENPSASENKSAQSDVTGTYSYETRELYAERGENQIYGVIYVPQGAGEEMPTVIFSHGLGGNYRVGRQYAEALASHGYVVYCFDFCGGSSGSKSDGSTLEMSIFTEQADLEAVISLMQSLDYVDSDNLFLIGTSQGGAVSAITGAAHPDEIRGMVLLYPAFVLVDQANELFQSEDEIPDTYHFLWMNLGRTYFEPLLNYDVYTDIAAYDKDVLLIHGDADSIVPLSYSERALKSYASARLEVLPGAGHGFSGEDANQAIRWMLEYLNTHIVFD